MKLSERIYKFIDDVGGVGPNNETRVRSLCKEVAQLEEENEELRCCIDEAIHSIDHARTTLLKATEDEQS